MGTGPNTQATAADADLMIDIAAGVVDARTVAGERRTDERYPYTTNVGVARVDDAGHVLQPLTLAGRNISIGGICLAGRNVFAPGAFIILQLVRSNGSTAIVGARVQHCRYIGNMIHETGFLFTPLPAGVKPADLLAADGTIRPLRGLSVQQPAREESDFG